MTTTTREAVIRALPYARRYARALAGDQARGDAIVAGALRMLVSPGNSTDVSLRGGAGLEPLHALYAQISQDVPEQPGGLSRAERQLLLLTSLEGLTLPAAAAVLGLGEGEAAAALEAAHAALRETTTADVLIIEDEPIIAMDIEELVRGCGHRVVGLAASEAEAVELARRDAPSLILADINLGGGGSGTAAVARIVREHAVPVIYVTAYPERLLTGEAIEPAFIITKPFEPLTLAVATFQAVTAKLQLA